MGTLTTRSDAERSRALARFRMLRPHLEDGVPLARIARGRGVTPRTLERWVARYRAEGLAGLARRTRADAGSHRVPDRLQLLIEGLALEKPRRGVASIRRKACEVAQQEGWLQPGYKLVSSIVHGLDSALVSLAHEGNKGYQQAFDLIHRREASGPNEIWQADHTQLDVRLLDERGESARPWLTAIIDDYSRVVPGYYLTFSAPSALGTALALHQAIWRKGDAEWQACGIPDTFYTDHGPDFTSKHIEQVAADIEMGLVYWPLTSIGAECRDRPGLSGSWAGIVGIDRQRRRLPTAACHPPRAGVPARRGGAASRGRRWLRG